MNRTLKFRAWDIKNKRMLAVDEIKNLWTQETTSTDPNDLHMLPRVTIVNQQYRGDDIELAVGEDCELMQYTGLKDINDKEIYEGDIVLLKHWKSSDIFDYNQPFEVSYKYGQVVFIQNEYYNYISDLNGNLYKEIVGNIYENPYLLGK